MTNVYVREDERVRDLDDVMEFDHVIRVHADGRVSQPRDVYAPDLHDGELQDGRWTLMAGYTGQHGYRGPLMHQSESIGGHMAEDILAAPGLYVALVDYPSDGSEPEAWAVAYILDK